jgi:glycosyltransferase involved in cell wall biosynthesis
VSDLDGPKEIVETLHSGLLVKPNDPADLAEKIHQVQNDYISNNILNTNYLIKDKKQMAIFDIQTTAKLYIKYYVL